MRTRWALGARAALAVVGALLAVLSIYSGTRPGPLLSTLQGNTVSTVVVFAALSGGGLWVLRSASASAWRWALGIGTALTLAQVAGLTLRVAGDLDATLWQPATAGWMVVHVLGTWWMLCGLVAAVITVLDRYGDQVWSRRGMDRSDPRPVRPVRHWLVLTAILVACRVPFLVVYWPGIVWYDSLRSFSYVRGLGPWQSYEPVGSTMLIGVFDSVGRLSGGGDEVAVATASVTFILTSCTALALMLTRMAVWGVPRAVRWAGLVFVALLPLFGYFSISLIKDVPFTTALLVFVICCGELAFRPAELPRARWPWIGLVASGIGSFALRNNGSYIVALAMIILLVVLRHRRKRLLAAALALATAFGLWIGPVYAALRVEPGPAEEAYSVPIQQLARIAKDHADTLTPTERNYLMTVFAGMGPEELGKHYVPTLSDPMKLRARMAWQQHSTGEFLTGWAELATTYPWTAITATLANTQGYWDPEQPAYDGFNRGSEKDSEVRGVFLQIPGGRPTTGLAGAIEASGIMPTKTYGGLQENGYLTVPLLGLAMSPAPICWLWVIGALLVVRRRGWPALAVFAPAAGCLVTFLAGPVSGGQRYALSLFLALPLAAAAVVLTARKRGSQSSSRTVVTAKPRSRRRSGSTEPRATIGVTTPASPSPVADDPASAKESADSPNITAVPS